jgi:UDP-glucose 4-epimerase
MVLGVIGLTGATGMLGRHVHAALDDAGYTVCPVTRIGEFRGNSTQWDLSKWESDAAFDEIFSESAAIVHAGALVPGVLMPGENVLYDVNVRACVNLAQWALRRNVPVIFVSGAIVYADTLADGIVEDAPLGWAWGGYYGFTKLLAEDVWRRFRSQGLQVAVLRPSSIYGCGLHSNKTISRFLASARDDRAINLSPPVDDRLDLVHAADVARAVVAVLNRNAWDTFNIGSGGPISLKELAQASVDVCGSGHLQIDGTNGDARLPVTRYGLNCDKARDVLGWSPQIDIRMGLKMILTGHVAYKNLAISD